MSLHRTEKEADEEINRIEELSQFSFKKNKHKRGVRKSPSWAKRGDHQTYWEKRV
jgi:hypothetical protein